MRFLARLSVVNLVVFAFALVAAAPTFAASTVTRYFEVLIQPGGQLDSGADCFGSETACPLGGDYLLEHDMSWGWKAYALVVAQRTGNHTTMHLIGPVPRVAAYFTEQTDYSSPDHKSCFADFSTSGGKNLTRYLATTLRFADDNGHMNVGVSGPIGHHFAQCGQGTVSQHGRDGARASWDGLEGPWNYVGVRGPTRSQVMNENRFAYLAWSQGLGVTHAAGGWPHKSGGGSSVLLSFTRFAGGQSNVLGYERNFVHRHPVNSPGFRAYNRFNPAG